MTSIFHITPIQDWQNAQATGEYRADSLAAEGFIHCSTLEQVIKPANEMFWGQNGLALLVIDSARVTAVIVYEDCYETGMKFPHIYGPINLDAVVNVVDFPPNPDGSFSLPPSVIGNP